MNVMASKVNPKDLLCSSSPNGLGRQQRCDLFVEVEAGKLSRVQAREIASKFEVRLPDEGWKAVIDKLTELQLPEAKKRVMVTLAEIGEREWERRDREALAPIVRAQILDTSAGLLAEASSARIGDGRWR